MDIERRIAQDQGRNIYNRGIFQEPDSHNATVNFKSIAPLLIRIAPGLCILAQLSQRTMFALSGVRGTQAGTLRQEPNLCATLPQDVWNARMHQ